MLIDGLLMAGLGFVGSFGHCAGMCGPLAIALAGPVRSAGQTLRFHLLLNLGRLLSYGAVGAAMGGLSSVVVAGGALAGVGSPLRRGVVIATGSLLVAMGLAQILQLRWPSWNRFAQLHRRLHRLLQGAVQSSWGVLVGAVWGLVPCGFLYTAQVKAAATGHPWQGAAMMLAFGLGTLPVMLAAGFSTRLLAPSQRQAVYRLGGWLTLVIGLLTLLRTGEMPLALSGYGALVCLVLALVARPLQRLWAAPLRCRRGLGLSAFVLSLVHTAHMLEHSWGWQLQAIQFMLPQSQWGIGLGGLGLGLMLPAALTSFDRAQQRLGPYWRRLHLLSVPALAASVGHCILTGSRYLGRVQPTLPNGLATAGLVGVLIAVLAVRSPRLWRWLGKTHRYAAPTDSEKC